MSEGEVEALKARLAGLGVQLGPIVPGLSPGSAASASTTPRVIRKPANAVVPPGRRSRSPGPRRSSADGGETLAVAARKSPKMKRPQKRSPDYDSDRSVDVAELLERCSRVEKILSSTRTAAAHAEGARNLERAARAMSEPPVSRRRGSPKKAARGAKAGRAEAPYPFSAPPRPAARNVQQQEFRASRSPLASVLEQYREAETLWMQEKAKLRRELVEQRKRANKFEMEYKKLVNQYDSRAVDIKSLRAALKNRDSQIQQMTVKVRETETSLRRCNDTAAEELACLTEERDDLKSLLQVTLQRLESVDEVLHRADVSTAMMEEKIKALDLERLKAVNRAAVARAEADTLAKNQTKLKWQSKMLERLSGHIAVGKQPESSTSHRSTEQDSDDSDDE
mmetsp:Transcript_34455/g.97635  ORF Transcript_34455/g.97635 Transcript_34455/m.97635 type:complete len:395 (-) Transcript_34455:152-1336(-)|eukprot:CAMPEP_0117659974 /NCGR_PEP_ID=MMETSP0804-20121206/6716_1 /TAXON_ID=1074897 /ORGANISM="Tetraselmis astigmatica, Strain CCMP880" /LENGTH=394 /DNA_ID=CAMNT_0005466663 /DNA_START=514 /DNA_END=1698 /DNA_ORIENTATION=+